MPDIRFHDLRHTAATIMLEAGVPLTAVSGILGHANPSITARLYAHSFDEGKRNAVDIMQRIFAP